MVNIKDDEEDPEYGIPRIEDAINSMVHANMGVNRKMHNLFGNTPASSRPMSVISGVFGGEINSRLTSPNGSIVRD